MPTGTIAAFTGNEPSAFFVKEDKELAYSNDTYFTEFIIYFLRKKKKSHNQIKTYKTRPILKFAKPWQRVARTLWKYN
jgi:hypothetical protein